MKQPSVKRSRLIIDRLLDTPFPYGPQLLGRRLVDQLRGVARKAHRFVFDDDATTRVGQIARELPELIAREHAFARPPYDVCWIEFRLPPLWEAVNQRQSGPESDDRIGYLIDHGTVYCFSAGKLDGTHPEPIIMPIVYDLHTGWPRIDQMKVAYTLGESRLTLAAHFWGSAFSHLDHNHQTLLRNGNVMRLLPINDEISDKTRAYRHIFSETAGELRNIITLLLVLNRPQITRYEQIATTRGFSRGKMRPYLSHTLVKIDTDPAPVLRTLGTPAGEAVARRRHEVRGHWRHNQDYHAGRQAGCIHTWEQHPGYGDDLHWLCGACQGERWWVNHHLRGSAIEGFAIRDGYSVGSSADRG